MTCTETQDLAAALDVGSGDLVSLVGGGGKTTAMYRLIASLRRAGLRAAAATTTKIAPPLDGDGATLLLAADWSELRRRLVAWDWSGPSPALADGLLSTDKVKGIPGEWCDRVVSEGLVDVLVVEADGAARRPVKAPEAWEPVVPDGTTHFVAVLGLSCAGLPLGEDVAFRTERIGRVTGLAPGDPLGTEALATLLTSPEGLLKGCPLHARVAVLLNQVELFGGREAGRRITADVFGRSHAPERVVIASLRTSAPLEVWKP